MKFPRMNQTNDHSELWQFSSIMKRMDTYLEKRYAVIAGYGDYSYTAIPRLKQSAKGSQYNISV